MEIKTGVKFIHSSDKDLVYTIYKIKDGEVWMNWKGNGKGTHYTLHSAKTNFKNKIWIPVEQITVERDELIEHELLDRASIVLDVFNRYVQAPAQQYKYLKDNAILAEIQEISEALYNLYQNLGNLD